jgi:hypothetical protein
LWLEESSRLGSGGIFGRGTGGESGLVATSLFRVNARPRKPIAIKTAPATISQWGNPIDESRSRSLDQAADDSRSADLRVLHGDPGINRRYWASLSVILNRHYCPPLGSAAIWLQISPGTPIRNLHI